MHHCSYPLYCVSDALQIFIIIITITIICVAWRRSVVVSALASVNVVNRHWARLLLGRVTTCVWVCNQPSTSTQPSTLCGMVKWVSAFGLSNNNADGGCGFLQASRVRWLGPKVGSHLALFCIHSVNRVNSRNDSESWCQHHKHCPGYCYYYCYYYLKLLLLLLLL